MCLDLPTSSILRSKISRFRIGTPDVRTSNPVYELSANHICSRLQYPEDMYEKWASPGPLRDLLPQSANRTLVATSIARPVASDHRVALPTLSKTKHYAKSVRSYLLAKRPFIDYVIDSLLTLVVCPQFDVSFLASRPSLVSLCYCPTKQIVRMYDVFPSHLGSPFCYPLCSCLCVTRDRLALAHVSYAYLLLC